MRISNLAIPIVIVGLLTACGNRPSEFTSEEWASYKKGNPDLSKALEWIESNPNARIEMALYLKWHKQFFILTYGPDANYLRHSNGLHDAIGFDLAVYGRYAMSSDTADRSLSTRVIRDYSEELHGIEQDQKVVVENGSKENPHTTERARLLKQAITEFEDLRYKLYAIPKDQ